MGREIRKVPANWEHPKDRYGKYQPLYDKRFEDVAKDWKNGFQKWENGEFPEYASEESRKKEFWEYEGRPPDREYYRTYSDAEQVWFQLYETVSEGTPLTPPFATEQELIDYLVENGDFWYQSSIKEGRYDSMHAKKPTREQAEALVKEGWAPSMVVTTSSAGVSISDPYESAELFSKEQ